LKIWEKILLQDEWEKNPNPGVIRNQSLKQALTVLLSQVGAENLIHV
jgi:hypothetical protein